MSEPQNPPILPEHLEKDVKTIHEAISKLHQMGATGTAESAWSAIERIAYRLQYIPESTP